MPQSSRRPCETCLRTSYLERSESLLAPRRTFWRVHPCSDRGEPEHIGEVVVTAKRRSALQIGGDVATVNDQ